MIIDKFIKKYGKYVVKASRKIAEIEANSACPYFSYQPEQPSKMKSLRKF